MKDITSYRLRKKSVLDILNNDEFKEFIIFDEQGNALTIWTAEHAFFVIVDSID